MILLLLNALEQELKAMVTHTPLVMSIHDFLKQYSGKEKLINLYNQYNITNPVSIQYFQSVVEAQYVTFKVGKYVYVDFDQRVE